MTRAPTIERHPQNLRGTNYIASIAYGTDRVLGMLPFGGGANFVAGSSGFFDVRHNADELRALASYGINNIRVMGSFWAWVIDAPAYMAVLRAIANNCRQHGISITYVLWSTTTAKEESRMYRLVWGEPPRAGLVRRQSNWRLVSSDLWAYTASRVVGDARFVPDGEPWLVGEYDEPGNILFRNPYTRWDSQLVLFIYEYLKDVAEFFGTEPGASLIASYDLFNEADVARNLATDVHIDVAREHRVEFIAATYFILTAHHRNLGTQLPPCTVGWAFMSEYSKLATMRLRAMGVAQRYLSSHSYEFRPEEFRRLIRDARDFAAARGLPYVCSEFWERRVPGLTPTAPGYPRSMGPYLDVITEELVGGQVWGFLAYNVFDIINGIPQAVDGFITPEKHVFTPLRLTTADVAVQPPLGGLLEPHPWPRRVRVELTPPTAADVAAVKRWTTSRGLFGVG